MNHDDGDDDERVLLVTTVIGNLKTPAARKFCKTSASLEKVLLVFFFLMRDENMQLFKLQLERDFVC